MDWITASFIMFTASVVRYLLIRHVSRNKIPSQVINLSMFGMSLVIYCLLAVFSRANMSLDLYQALIIVVLAVFFSYLGNKFSLESIELAPNPGYSLIISKSYVVFTTLASIFLFGSELTLKAVVAIAIIISFSTLILIPSGSQTMQHHHKNKRWLLLAIGSFFCWGMLSLTTKYLFGLGVSILARLIYSMTIVVTLISIEIKRANIDLTLIKKHDLSFLLLIGLFSAAFDYFSMIGFDLAPNIGYVNAINASSISLVTFFSFLMFKDELTKQKLLGVIGVTAGLILLVM